MSKPLDQRVRDTIGQQAWQLLLLQQQIEELTEQLAAKTAQIAAMQTPPADPPEG